LSTTPIHNVKLVQPPMSDGYHGVSRSKDYPSLGLLSIATYLKHKDPSVQVEILDGEVVSLEKVETQTNGDIVGISVNILNYKNAIEIAKKAKESGATVIFGGAHAIALADVILRNREFVDTVVTGEGEVALADIIAGKPYKQICNLCYRNNGRVIKTPPLLQNLDSLPFPDRTFVNQDIYFQNFARQRPWCHYKKPALIYSQKGCLWRVKTGGCLFCGRMDAGWRARSPEKVWEEISQLVSEHGVDYINDVSGSIAGDRTWLKYLCETKPPDVNPALEVYACAHELDNKVIDIFTKLNVYKVFLGVESGTNVMLQRIGKPPLAYCHLNVLRALNSRGIKATLGVVIGAPGETEETIRQTVNHIERLVEIGNVETISCSILVPVPGSQAYSMILQHPELKEKYSSQDDVEATELEKDWLEYFCFIDYPSAREAVEEILALAPLRSSMALAKQTRSMVKSNTKNGCAVNY